MNSKINLSAIRDPEGIQIKHIQDSLEINKVVELKPGSTLCDVGTWGWFPLLPIAMTNHGVTCTGIDATRKKIDAINEMIKELDIPNAHAVWSRAEDHKEVYDYVTARAVGYIDKLLPQIHHLTKHWGYLILYKQYTMEESEDIKNFSKDYGFRIKKIHKYTLFAWDIPRIIYVLKKIDTIALYKKIYINRAK